MKKNSLYTYTTMEKRIRELEKQYPPEYFRVNSLGITHGKRQLYSCCLGSSEAPGQFVITASIHGREYINTTLLLRIMEYYLEHYEGCYQELWKEICVIFLPMTNPDGVCISMSTEAKTWKENGRGVDLNRNFPSGFGQSPDRAKRNPGVTAGDQQETRCLMEFVNGLSNPLGIIHYHSRGNLIYYDYNVHGSLKSQITTMAAVTHRVTGYRLVENTKDTRPAGGFGDWCVYEKKIPSITIETGFLKTPVPRWQLKGIIAKNLFLLRELFTCIL
ncbi:MAG: hypothetical protein HFG34_12505 [Eubacterium sp.]|nr:hypothetical protein [Eubacterium sp.]